MSYCQLDNDLKQIHVKEISKNLWLNDHFWRLCDAQIEMSKIDLDPRTRFPGSSTILRNVAQDLNNSSLICRMGNRVLKHPLNTVMVYYCELPKVEYSNDQIELVYRNQLRLRKMINEELMELMIVASHIQYDQHVIGLNDPFWKFSLEVVNAINDLGYLLIATNYPLLRDLAPVQVDRRAPQPWDEA